MKLRPYQGEGYTQIQSSFIEFDIIMFVLATGGGKTVTFVEVVKTEKANGGYILQVAHRQELIAQAHKTFADNGMHAGIIKAEYPMRPEFRVQVGSIQTIAKRKNELLRVFPNITLIVIDEGHHVQDDNTYGALMQLYPNAKVLIVTATPYRLSGKGFTNIYPGKEVKLIVNATNKELIEDGWLVPFEYHIGSNPNLKNVKIEKGDYNEDDLERVMGTVPIVESYLNHCAGKSGICFAVNVTHSISLAEKYCAAGVSAVHVDANTPSEVRHEYFKKFRAKEILVIVNVGILTEGTDFPICQFVQDAAPTKSLSKFLQKVGRVTRALFGIVDSYETKEERKAAIAASDKPVGIVLDNCGSWLEHGFPDDDIDWPKYFEGWQKLKLTKKEEAEMMELLLFEVVDPETGESKTVKTIKETEGMILIKVTKENRDAISGLRHINKFEEIYLDALSSRYIDKPGYNTYFKYRKYLASNNIKVTDQIWKHIKNRLIDDIEIFKNNYINSELAAGRKVVPAVNVEINKLKLKGISEGFFKREYQVYKQTLLDTNQKA